jgi:hypothetical protein
MWWTAWHWDRFSAKFFSSSCQYHSTAAPYSLMCNIEDGQYMHPLMATFPKTCSQLIVTITEKLKITMVSVILKCCNLFHIYRIGLFTDTEI